MPTTQDGKKTGSAARAEAAEDNSYVSKDTFSNPALTTLTNTATAEDAMGIERVVLGSSAPFVPAPLEATDAQKQRMEQLNSTLDEAKEQRISQLKAGVQDAPSEERAANEPYNAGSQTGATSDKQTTTGEANKAAEKKEK